MVRLLLNDHYNMAAQRNKSCYIMQTATWRNRRHVWIPKALCGAPLSVSLSNSVTIIWTTQDDCIAVIRLDTTRLVYCSSCIYIALCLDEFRRCLRVSEGKSTSRGNQYIPRIRDMRSCREEACKTACFGQLVFVFDHCHFVVLVIIVSFISFSQLGLLHKYTQEAQLPQR